MRRPGAGPNRRGDVRSMGGFVPATGAVAAPVNSVAPVIAWTVATGNAATITPGTWSGSPTLTYTLYRDGVAVGAQTSRTEAQAEAYTAVAADVAAASLLWRETATNAGGSSSADSNAVSYGVTTTTITGLRARYRMDSVTTTGSAITQMTDTSGVGNHVTDGGTAGRRPTLTATDAAFNNRPTATFDNVGNYLSNAAFSWGGAVAAATILVVVRIDTATASDRIVDYVGNLILRMNGTALLQFLTVGTGSAASTGTTAFTTPPKVGGGDWVGVAGNNRVLFENTAEDTDANTRAAIADGSALAVGASTTGTAISGITLAEVVIANAVLSAAQLADFVTYAKARYAV